MRASAGLGIATSFGMRVTAEVRINLDGLNALIAVLRNRGYEVIGPVVRNAAICYGKISNVADLASGWTAAQTPGRFSLERTSNDALFAFAAPANSPKNYFHPPEQKLVTIERHDSTVRFVPQDEPVPRYAFLGVHACDIAAMNVQDRCLTNCDPGYHSRRESAFVIAVQCTTPSGCCFCASMGTGPRAVSGFDLALTEFIDGNHEFLLEVATERGAKLLADVPFTEASRELHDRSHDATDQAACRMGRNVNANGVVESLRDQFDHPEWDDVAQRCLACGNCTMACPTCFCVDVEDGSDLSGSRTERWKQWDSCFSESFSYIHGGSVRRSPKSRYRQWLMHKFSYWMDQFGVLGCVGCGRCITWCPVGIDVTEEISRIRSGSDES